MSDKQLNHALEFTLEEKKVLRQIFSYITTTKKNIHMLFRQQGSEYAEEFIRLCEESIAQGFVSRDLHNIIKDVNFITLFDDFGGKVRNQDPVSQTIICQLRPIIDRLGKQLPGLNVIGKIDLPQKKRLESAEVDIKIMLKNIADELKANSIAHHIFDGSNDEDKQTLKIKKIIKDITKIRKWKDVYTMLCDTLYGPSDKDRGDTPENWDVFVSDIYKRGGVEMPSTPENLKINGLCVEDINQHLGKIMSEYEFYNIQNKTLQDLRVGDEILGLYTGHKDNTLFFSIGRHVRILIRSTDRLDHHVVVKLHITDIQENTNPHYRERFPLIAHAYVIDS